MSNNEILLKILQNNLNNLDLRDQNYMTLRHKKFITISKTGQIKLTKKGLNAAYAFQRKQIYYNKNYNPYSFDNLESLLTCEEFCLFKKNLKFIINKFNKLTQQIRKDNIEYFLRNIPHTPIYSESHIENSKVLLVANEAGLSNIQELYSDLIYNGINEQVLADAFWSSMKSWLSLTGHKNLKKNGKIKINGERIIADNIINYKNDNDKSKFLEIGKIAYFVKSNETNIFKGYQCIHIDLFPYPQKKGRDINENNAKRFIEKIVCEKDKEIRIQRLESLCHYLTYKILKKNIHTILDFCKKNNGSEKYIFIIGNRINIEGTQSEKPQIIRDNKHGNDNTSIIFDIIRLLYEEIRITNKIEIRLIDTWPFNFNPNYAVPSI